MDLALLVDELDRAAPGFRAYLGSEEHCFGNDNAHAAFAACSHFVRENALAPETWERLASLVNQLVDGGDADLDNAACTCFLENLASPSHPLKVLLRGEALAYWERWE